MPGKWLGDTAFLSQSFERTQTTSIRWYRKDSAILAQSTIFLHYLLGIVKQLDVGFRSCLLSVDNNPLAIVKKCLDVLFLQVVQVNECEACETRKKHQSKGDRNKENQTQPVVNKRFCSRLPLQPNSRERQDNARFPLPSHYLFRNLPEA